MMVIRGISLTVVDQDGNELQWDDEGVESEHTEHDPYACKERLRLNRKMLAVLAVSGLIWLLVIASVLLAIWVGR